MSATVQLESTIQLHDAPKLLVEWSPRGREFISSLRPALARSHARLAGEAPFGLIPFRIVVPAYALEAFLVFAAIAVQLRIDELRPHVVPRVSGHEVIYYTGDELPRTEDLGGSEAGKTGRAGGDEAQHRTQTIKIARGGSLVPKVVDAPNLKLPSSRDAVANLLAIRPDPGPPPLEGLRSARSSITLPTSLIAPPPNAIRDYTRNGIQLESVVAPAPSLTRDQLTAPNFSASVIPPAPKITSEHTLVAPALAPNVIAPAPSVSREHALSALSLNAAVVPPAPTISRAVARSAPLVAGNVIPPAPAMVTQEISSAPVEMTSAVVPPPVSAPERAPTRNAKLNLPAPSVVAPPPSADISQDMRRLASGSASDPSQAVVPPPPTQPASGSFMSSLIGKIFGATEVAPPPPSVSSSGPSRNEGSALAATVIPPPPSVPANQTGGKPRGARNAMGSSLGSNVVAPPPVAGVSGGAGTRALATSAASTLGLPNIVPPPPALSGPGGGTGTVGGGSGTPGGTLLANNVVPPPPSVGGGTSTAGSGLGRKGPGFGSAMDVGAPSAPASNGGSGNNAGAVISSQPGSKVGLPVTGGTGALAMSPSGGEKSGLGGSGGGTGIGRDNGSGSGVTGSGTGAGKSGAGRGSDPTARGGISSSLGPGGAGNAVSGNPAVPGVSITGGSTVVTLPSFGSDPSANDPSGAARSSIKHGRTLDVTIVATATSGGAFEPYKNLLHGQKYTTYFLTSLGTVVMEFADEAASGHAYAGTLARPEAIRTELPDGLPRARMVVRCTLDASGNLKNVRVLEAGLGAMSAKVTAALANWKFQPVMRGDQPVEVTAILGFGIDTNDRF